jgi:hypothetical protein
MTWICWWLPTTPVHGNETDYGCAVELHSFTVDRIVGIARSLRYDSRPVALSKLYGRVLAREHAIDVIAAAMMLGPGIPAISASSRLRSTALPTPGLLDPSGVDGCQVVGTAVPLRSGATRPADALYRQDCAQLCFRGVSQIQNMMISHPTDAH